MSVFASLSPNLLMVIACIFGLLVIAQLMQHLQESFNQLAANVPPTRWL